LPNINIINLAINIKIYIIIQNKYILYLIIFHIYGVKSKKCRSLKITKVQFLNQSKLKIIISSLAKTKNALSKMENRELGELTQEKKEEEKDGAESV